MKKNKALQTILGLFLISWIFSIGLSTPSLFAQERNPDGPGILVTNNIDTAQQEQQRIEPNVFGGQTNILQIPASSFTIRQSGVVYEYGANAYIFVTSSPFAAPLWATVTLPSGVVIDSLNLYYYDNDPINDISACLKRFYGWDAPGNSDVVCVTSSGTPGYGYQAAPTNHTVNNDVRNGNGSQYAVTINLPSLSNTNQFKGVDIWWHRQVSPAPATATFSDVLTSHPFFRFVEALAAAGITGGCGSGNFCPDNAVTRGQMAVFLSAALGLHYSH